MKEYIVREYEMEDYDNYKRNVTAEETIRLLEYIARGYLPDYNYMHTEDDYEYFKMHVAIDNAIRAIKLLRGDMYYANGANMNKLLEGV